MDFSKNTVEDMVSVIIPNYNYASYIGEAIESVLSQTYENYEIIVVDDNSDDNSRVIVNQYVIDYPQKVQLIYNEAGPSGTPNAINLGISRMKGEFFCWLSSDDVFVKNKLERQVEIFKKNFKTGMVFTNYDIISEDGEITVLRNNRDFSDYSRYDLLLKMLNTNVINGNTVMIRRSVFESLGIFEGKWEKYPHSWIGTEYLKWLEIILHYDVKYTYAKLHLSRRHKGNSVYGPAGVWGQVSALMLEKFFTMYKPDVFWQTLGVFNDKEKCADIETHIMLILKRYHKSHLIVGRISAIEELESFISEKVMRNLEAVDYFDFIASIARAKVLDDRNTASDEFLSYNYNPDCLGYFEAESIYSVASAFKKCCDFKRSLELFNYLEGNVILDPDLNSGIYFHIGEICFKKSNLLKAKDYFEKCIGVNAGHKKAKEYIDRIIKEL